ncbi:MAG TPA: Gfo/Idh/MocA family oxidoreductase, partial [Phenylobacterium sp.]|nr:Gfo/Idh/MocA family oxidoreductase [Phenylobacterium sp.]
MPESLRGGVIGAGVFGGYHARQYARLPGVVLSAVLDTHPDRAAAVAMPLGGRGFADMAEFLDAVDIVTVASPATFHAEHALAALAAGKNVYIEKPIATSVADGEKVRAAAEARGLVVACGHQERVVFRAMGLLDIPEQPLRLEALRHGPPSDRSRDVSAVLDLMVHDLDLALAISAADPVTAEGEGRLSGDRVWDVARAEVSFEDGFT